MKKQKFEKKLCLRVRKISQLSNLETIIGGRTLTCNPCIISDVKTCQPLFTEAHRCTHTIGNGQNPDGTPCTF